MMAICCKDSLGIIRAKEDIDKLSEVLQDETITKFVYDVKMLYHLNLDLKGKIYDTLLMAYLLEPAKRSYEMNVLWQMADIEEEIPWENLNEEEKLICGARHLADLSNVLADKLVDEKMVNLYEQIELPLAKMLCDMETVGIYINEQKLDDMNEQMYKQITALEQDIYELAGEIFNINSPKQLGDILFNKLGLPALKKTKTGYSTNAEVLENLIYAHPIIAKILDYRMLNKLKTTYLDGLKALINPQTKRIHTSFNQTVTETGRLSSSEPNLQNIPVRTAEGKKFAVYLSPAKVMIISYLLTILRLSLE